MRLLLVLVLAAALLPAGGAAPKPWFDAPPVEQLGAPVAQALPTAVAVPTAAVAPETNDHFPMASICPVTQPPASPFGTSAFAPPGVPEAPKDHFWHGSAALWTMLPANGIWRDLPLHDGFRSQKSVWWSEGYDWQAEPEPALTVTGRRLDAAAPPLPPHPATNAYHEDWGAFMINGLAIPSEGCWEFTGSYRDAQLSFVVWVAP